MTNLEMRDKLSQAGFLERKRKLLFGVRHTLWIRNNTEHLTLLEIPAEEPELYKTLNWHQNGIGERVDIDQLIREMDYDRDRR